MVKYYLFLLWVIIGILSKMTPIAVTENDALKEMAPLPSISQNNTLFNLISPIINEEQTPLAEQKISILMELLNRHPLSIAEATALQQYILSPCPSTIAKEKWAWIVNDSLRLLCFQQTYPTDLPDTLYALYENKERDIVIRDYAVQHMGILISPAPGSTITINHVTYLRLTKTLMALARDGRSRFCGTALNALANAANHDDYNCQHGITNPFITSPVDLAIIARTIALDTTALPENRATAFGVCAQLRDTKVLPMARDLAQDIRTPLSVRMASIHLVSQIGESSDREWLQSIADKSDFPLNQTAQIALKKLTAKPLSE